MLSPSKNYGWRFWGAVDAPIQPQSSREHATDIVDWICVCVLFLLALCTRLANRGALYFVDGPRIVNAIVTKLFVVQNPGYWALARLGGLFRNPEAGLAFWNILFSALGTAVFFLLCRLRRTGRALCFAAACAFSVTYFVWFAGEIHSSYASQIFFPVMSIYCFLRSEAGEKEWWAVGWALSAGVGMALRPSDGAFLLPLFLYLLWRYVKRPRVWIIFFAVNAVIFLGWYLPTRAAISRFPYYITNGSTVAISMRTVSPLVIGLNQRSLANASRVVVPLLVAFWALVPALISKRDRQDNSLALFWMLPGLCFFLLCYVADPTYMVFLSGALFWMVITSYKQRRAFICVAVCGIFNACLFLGAQPLVGNGLTREVTNFYVVKYCRYGITHRWSSTIGDGARLP